ncbi:MAG: CHAD domain-containing protein [Acidimicrobiia bacterium]
MPHSFTAADSADATDASADRIVEALGSWGFEVDAPVATTRTLLDTFDGRLHRAGLRLELRRGTGADLVLAAGSGSPPAVLPWSGEAPRTVADLPAGPFRARLAPQVAERALLPMIVVRSQRREARRRDRRAKPVVTVVVDDELRCVDQPEAPLPAWFAQVVPVVGHDDDLARTVGRLRGLGVAPDDREVLDVALAATGRTAAGRTSSPTVPLDPADGALDAFRAVLRNLLATVVDNLPGTLADLDPEFLHELRVAVRRTRSVLAQGRGVLPDDVRDRFRTGFGQLGVATGPSRDLDVYVLGWHEAVAPLQLDPSVTDPLLAALEDRRAAARAEMATVLRSPATEALLGDWDDWLTDPDVHAGEGDPPIGEVVARRVARAQRALLEHGRAIDRGSPAEALHDLRKDAKKLRYVLECFGSLLPAKPRKAFVTQLKDLQDNLGAHQDAEVQLGALRDLAVELHERDGADADVLLAVGRMIGELDRRRQEARDDFHARFAAYDTKRNRALLDELARRARP